MKKLFSLLLVLALALVPTLSLADDDAACQNLYNMLLDELKSVDLEMTADEESYRIYLGYALDKNSLGDADVIFDAYSMPSPSTSATPIRLMRRLCRR